jgi:hypothetical protein
MLWLCHDRFDNASVKPECWRASGKAQDTWDNRSGHGVHSEPRIAGCRMTVMMYVSEGLQYFSPIRMQPRCSA